MGSDGLGENRRDIHLILAATFFYMMSPMMVTPLIVEPTVQVSINGKTYEMAAGDVVNLPVLEKTGFEFLGLADPRRRNGEARVLHWPVRDHRG